MRILHSIHSVNPGGGGVVEAVRQVAQVHEAKGHTCEVVSLDGPDDVWVRDCSLKVHALGPGRTSYGYSPRFLPWLAAHRGEYDAVIVNRGPIRRISSSRTGCSIRGSGALIR